MYVGGGSDSTPGWGAQGKGECAGGNAFTYKAWRSLTKRDERDAAPKRLKSTDSFLK